MPIREKSIKEKDARLKLNEISGFSMMETSGVLMCEKENLQKTSSHTTLSEYLESVVS